MLTPLVLALIAAAAAPAAPPLGWRVVQHKDPVTDKVSINAMLRGPKGALVIGCSADEKRFAVVQSDEYLGGRGAGPAMRDITFRFDTLPASTTGAGYDGHMVVLGQQDAGAIEKLSSISTRLIIRATTFRNESVDLVFSYPNGAAAMRQLDRECSAIGQ